MLRSVYGNNRLRLAILPALVLAAVGIAACRPAGPAGDAARPRIAGIIFQEDQFFRMVRHGMQQTAAGAGVEFISDTSSNLVDREASLIETYIGKQVDAIIISPVSMKSSIPALKRAADKGIAIITYNTTVDNDIPVAFVESSQSDLGGTTGKAVRAYIEQELAGTAKVAMIECIGGAPEQCSERSAGFMKELQDMPGVEIVARQDAFLAPKAADVVASILTANPDLDIIWAANEGGTVGAVTAVRNSRLQGKVRVFGTDISKQLGQFLLSDDDILQAVTGQQPILMGEKAMAAAIKALEGEPVEKYEVMPGVLYSRENPEEVKAFIAEVEKLTG
jgi:sugar transport system substrate-binding protein